MKFIMEALTSEVKRMFMAELKQFNERVEQSFEHPRNPLARHRRERLPRRMVRVEGESMKGMVLRMRMIMIWMLVIGGTGET